MATIESDHNDGDDDLLVAVKGSKFTSLIPLGSIPQSGTLSTHHDDQCLSSAIF